MQDKPSEDGSDPKITAPAHIAGGIPAISQTLRYGLGEMGARRTLRTLTSLNQKDGFDCPSCAWPDPDGHRAMAEFCENGAKAVAAEATLARVTPEFFAKHSVADLAGRGDMWLDHQGRLTHPMVLRAGNDHYEAIEWDAAFTLIAEGSLLSRGERVGCRK
jgi:anaerobic selenocysteine-containing dehydrogenase